MDLKALRRGGCCLTITDLCMILACDTSAEEAKAEIEKIRGELKDAIVA